MTPLYTDRNTIKYYLDLGLNKDGSFDATIKKDDQLISDAIGPFSDAVNDQVEWRLDLQTIANQTFERHMSTASRLQIDPQGFLILKTNSPTIQSVSAIAYKLAWTNAWIQIDTKFAIFETIDPDTRPTLTSYQIRIDPAAAGWLSWRTPFVKCWAQVSYTGGYATLPPPISKAVAEWIAYDYRLRQFIPTMSVGFIGMPMTVVKPARIPPHILALIDPYKRKAA